MRRMLLALGAGLAFAAVAQANPPGAGCTTCAPSAYDHALFSHAFSKFQKPVAFGHTGGGFGFFKKNADCGNCGPAFGHGPHWPGHHAGYGHGCGDGGCGKTGFWAWLTAPCPSSAPSRRTDYPLGFPSHPYARSPRDYFMVD